MRFFCYLIKALVVDTETETEEAIEEKVNKYATEVLHMPQPYEIEIVGRAGSCEGETEIE